MWLAWRRHFEERRLRPAPDLAHVADELPVPWRAPLAASLAVFQLGESRGGRLSQQIDGVHWRSIDDDYRAAVKLFVAEEQRHGDLLAGCVTGLGGELLEHSWTETLFLGLRRLVGVRFKLVVLLAAEVIGLAYYRTLLSRLPRGSLARTLEMICADEDFHLAFHADFFRAQLGPRARVATAAGWAALAGAAGAAVALDHRRALAALGIPQREFAARAAALIAAVARELAAPDPGPAPALDRAA